MKIKIEARSKEGAVRGLYVSEGLVADILCRAWVIETVEQTLRCGGRVTITRTDTDSDTTAKNP